jgi:hypothetical protein
MVLTIEAFMARRSILVALGVLLTAACSASSAEDVARDELELRPHLSPPVQPVGPHSPPEAPWSPGAMLPTTPIVVHDGRVARVIAGDRGVVEVTAVDPGVDRAISQPEAANVCRRLDYDGRTGWYLPDEHTLLAMVGKLDANDGLWSNVDLVQRGGLTGIDPTSGATDLRMMASKIHPASGAFQGADHSLSALGSTGHFVCIRTDEPIQDWRTCMAAASQLQRCICLGAWFTPPRDHWECRQ